MAVKLSSRVSDRVHCVERCMPLSLVLAGKEVSILQIRGGRRFSTRLRDLGLNQNAIVRVIKNDLTGPLIIAVKQDGRLAIGRGQANRIFVNPE